MLRGFMRNVIMPNAVMLNVRTPVWYLKFLERGKKLFVTSAAAQI
jgi:hypothetical protein